MRQTPVRRDPTLRIRRTVSKDPPRGGDPGPASPFRGLQCWPRPSQMPRSPPKISGTRPPKSLQSAPTASERARAARSQRAGLSGATKPHEPSCTACGPLSPEPASGRASPHAPHRHLQLLGIDGAAAVCIEEVEGLAVGQGRRRARAGARQREASSLEGSLF